jgi:hypothetical protein
MEFEFPQWQKPYREALLELDPNKLNERIAAAEALILIRRHELDGRGSALEERLKLDDALEGLRSLKRIKLYYAHWETGWPRT